MKKKLKTKFKGIVPMLMGSLLLTYVSCSTESSGEEDLTSTEVISSTELKYSDETEMISEELMAIAEDVYAADEIVSTSKGGYNSDYLPDCVTVSVVMAENTKEITLDFGEGCELPTGNTLSGIVYLSYALDMEAESNTIELTLEDFTFNDVAIEGEADIVRVRSNENGNPEGIANGAFEATWPSGETASFTGTRTREWIDGYGTGYWGDNVFLITGTRTYISRAGNEFVKEVVTPLRRELSCRFIVSGVLEISRLGNTVSLDFGDGSCDAKGTLTYSEGAEEEIYLRRFLN
ncbi:MAG: hypothetical protein CMH46_17750 [Muricauda sp.]|nr:MULTISPECIES: hypothetical protein [unclassified Allomuricauda]MAU17373.1 hypothetical protein [Allomuricauda sp.]|tara:strand:- start:309 stop:1184 length:876 start_codon:yes stop_codon:yes gene_type:complete